MRNAQITIKMELFNDQAWDGNREEIGLYADADTPYEAICAAFTELMGALLAQGHKFPSPGYRSHQCKPSAAGLSPEQIEEVRKQRQAEREQHERELWEAFDKQNAAGNAVPEEE